MAQAPHFLKNLNTWYRHNARDLPWRKTSDPYKIWISEVMLQQTTVNAVIPYYLKWIRVFPSVKSVAKAPLQKVLQLWQGLGYYQRAKNIHRSSQIICDDYAGRIPNDPGVLKALPGFGPYTVGAVLSIAFGLRFPIIDANVRRVVMRQLGLRGFADGSHDKRIFSFLEKSMPKKDSGTFNQALMELGALICRGHEALCVLCPVRGGCLAYKKGIQEIIPTPKRTIIQKVNAVVAVISNSARYFIQKRPSHGLLADLWEFPGGKIEAGETVKIALNREIEEELGVTVKRATHVLDTCHFYTKFKVKLHVWRCELSSVPQIKKDRKWVKLRDLTKYPMPSGSAKIVDALISGKIT